MNIGIVVLELLLLLFRRESPQGVLEVKRLVLAAYHEANLATWIGSYVDVRVFDIWEYVAAVFENRHNHIEMDEMIFPYCQKSAKFLDRRLYSTAKSGQSNAIWRNNENLLA